MNYYYWKNKLLNKDLGFFSRTKKFKSSSPCSYTKIRGGQDTERSVQKKIKRIRNNFEGAKTSTTKVKTKSSNILNKS
jgi:hypothetical protein